MKDLLFVKKLHLPVFTTQKPDSMSEEEWDFEHQQVCGFIRQYVVLFGNMLKIMMFIIILLMRHMLELCGRRLMLNCLMNLRYRENSV